MIIRNFSEDEGNILAVAGQSVGVGLTAATMGLATASLVREMTKVLNRRTTALGVGGIIPDPGAAAQEDRNIYFIKNMFLNIISTMSTLMLYYYGNPFRTKPGAVIGGIPVGTVEELSHAMSDLLAKYRSDGGVFLAHQPGGKQTLRIKLLAFGKNRYVILSMIELLKIYGSASIVDVFKDINLSNSWLVGMTPEIDVWEQFEKDSLDQGKEERHLTFPVITQKKVYTNMYIGTYGVREYVDLGLNILEITIFFEKYNIPKHKKWASLKDEKTGKRLWYFNDEYNDPTTNKLRKIDMGLELGLSTALILYRMLMIMSGNSPERNIAVVTAIELNSVYNGGTDYDAIIVETVKEITQNDSLVGFSTINKEELMGLD